MKANWLVCILFLAVGLPAQTITTQPTNQVVIVGGNVTFSVAISGAGPFTYQWRFNGTNNLPPTGIITTVAGNGSAPFSGDGGAATNAEIQPTGVAVDAVGNLFIADDDNNRIRRVDTKGTIMTVAGNGNASFSGDGGAATNAALQNPFGVLSDTAGNLFIADSGNKRIRKMDTNGIITTVAGNGTSSFSGDGGAATNSGVFPHGMAVDRMGDLFITDSVNSRIRKVDTNGIITTVAGNGIQGFSGDDGPATNAEFHYSYGIAVDASGNLFFSDINNSRIRKVDTNGIITTVAGNGTFDYSGAGDGGAATNAGLASPYGVAVDALGNIFIADANTSRIRKVDTNGIITTVAGSANNGFGGDGGAATRAWLSNPFGVAVDASGNLFIADNSNFRIREVQYNSPELILSNISTNDAGNYSVAITGPGGSVTSSIVTLIVIIAPSITAPMMLANGQFQFGFDTVTRLDYAVEYSTNLMQWFPFVTVAGVGVPLTVIDPNTAVSQQRFYRIILSAQ